MLGPFRPHALALTLSTAFTVSASIANPLPANQANPHSGGTPASSTAMAPEASWEQLCHQGEKQLAAGQVSDAEKSYLAATQLAKQFGQFDPRLATSLDNLGLVYQKQGKLSAAEQLYRRALAIDEKTFGKAHANVSRDLLNLAILLTENGRFSEAETSFKAALAIDEQVGDPNHPFVAFDLEHYAVLLRKLNRVTEAEQLEARAGQIKAKVKLSGTAQNCDKYIAIGQDLFRAGNFAEAEKAFMTANMEARKLDPNDPRLATTLNNLAGVYDRLGRKAEAEKLLNYAFELDKLNYGMVHPTICRDLNNLALLYANAGKLQESERLYKMALELDEKVFGPEHANVAVGLQNYAALLRKLNRVAEAAPLERRANQISFKQRALAGRTANPQ